MTATARASASSDSSISPAATARCTRPETCRRSALSTTDSPASPFGLAAESAIIINWFHRTVEQYVGAVLDAGFEIETVSEFEPDPQRLADHLDELERRRRVPVALLIGARRRES